MLAAETLAESSMIMIVTMLALGIPGIARELAVVRILKK